MKKMTIGYTSGVYDLFHVGHLNMLRNAKSLCDKLIVGVTTDELVSYKNKKSIIPYHERMEIVRNIKCVDTVVPQEDMDKMKQWDKLKFDVIFVGDDWHNTEKWKDFESDFKEVGVKIVYFPYTKGISSTKLNEILNKARSKKK